MTITPQLRLIAALGVLGAAALALSIFILGHAAGADSIVPPPAHVTRKAGSTPRSTHGSVKRTAKPHARHFRTPPSGFPKAVDRAFRTHRVVVLTVYMPRSSVDTLVRKEARAGALSARAGYVPVSATNNVAASQILAKTGVLPDPVVLILRRPGVVVATLGVTDRQAVIQAVAQAKR